MSQRPAIQFVTVSSYCRRENKLNDALRQVEGIMAYFVSPPLNRVKVKEKCPPVQALRLCTDRTTYWGSRGIALPFHDHGTRRG